MKILPVINANYDNRMNFKSGVSEGQKVVQKAAPMAKDMFLKIGGMVFAGATTFEIVKKYLAEKLCNPEYVDTIEPYTNVHYDINTDSIDLIEIAMDVEKTIGRPLTDEELDKIGLSTVEEIADFIDNNKVQSENENEA